MNDLFKFYTYSAILNRELEFPLNIFWIKMRILRKFFTPISSKNDVMLSYKTVCNMTSLKSNWRPNDVTLIRAVIYQSVNH